MIYRRLGRTGASVSAIGLGGESALYKLTDESVRIVRRAHGLGINYFDTAPLYQDSELVYGEALPGIRAEVFVATKTDRRDYDGAWRQFEASLRRLRTSYVDLLQIHHLDFPEEVEAVLDPERGAVRMAEEARAQGLARFVGVTGHTDPEVLLAAIESHPFDTILMALNPGEVHVESFQERLLPRAVELGMGVTAMKVFARGILFEAGLDGSLALDYVLTLPVASAVVGVMNEAQLERNAANVSAFSPLSDEEMRALEDRAEPLAQRINFYRKGVDGDFPVPPRMLEEAL